MKKYIVSRVTGGLTSKLSYDLLVLQTKTGKTKSALIREALTLLTEHYKQRGIL